MKDRDGNLRIQRGALVGKDEAATNVDVGLPAVEGVQVLFPTVEDVNQEGRVGEGARGRP